MTLKVFDFNFWEQFGDSLYCFFESLWQIFTLIIVFLIIWGIVCVPFLILYVLIIKILGVILKLEMDTLKYITCVPVISFICTVLLSIFVL